MKGGVMATRHAVAACAVGVFGAFGAFAQSAGASHAGAIADCGAAGTFTVKATDIPSGFQAPNPGVVTVFEEGGTLAIMEFSVNGELFLSRAETGRAQRSVDEVTCSYTTGDGALMIEVTGILTA
jgi:hypothetical protein